MDASWASWNTGYCTYCVSFFHIALHRRFFFRLNIFICHGVFFHSSLVSLCSVPYSIIIFTIALRTTAFKSFLSLSLSLFLDSLETKSKTVYWIRNKFIWKRSIKYPALTQNGPITIANLVSLYQFTQCTQRSTCLFWFLWLFFFICVKLGWWQMTLACYFRCWTSEKGPTTKIVFTNDDFLMQWMGHIHAVPQRAPEKRYLFNILQNSEYFVQIREYGECTRLA